MMTPRAVHLVAAFLAASLFAALPAGAQITSIAIRVDGLACPFCAFSLEKKIRAVEGTKEPVINIEQGVVTLTPLGDVSIDFDDLREAVTNAGFTPRDISVEGIGRLAMIAERPILVAEGGRQLFRLAPNDVLARLQADAEHIVTFSGTVITRKHDDDTSLWTLTLLSAVPRIQGDVN